MSKWKRKNIDCKFHRNTKTWKVKRYKCEPSTFPFCCLIYPRLDASKCLCTCWGHARRFHHFWPHQIQIVVTVGHHHPSTKTHGLIHARCDRLLHLPACRAASSLICHTPFHDLHCDVVQVVDTIDEGNFTQRKHQRRPQLLEGAVFAVVAANFHHLIAVLLLDFRVKFVLTNAMVAKQMMTIAGGAQSRGW